MKELFGLSLGPEHRVALEQIRDALDEDACLDASARVNMREIVRLTFDPFLGVFHSMGSYTWGTREALCPCRADS
ncbi:MAG: hypothetical protein ACE5F1_21675 [Planctomycetota bacterium]